MNLKTLKRKLLEWLLILVGFILVGSGYWMLLDYMFDQVSPFAAILTIIITFIVVIGGFFAYIFTDHPQPPNPTK